MGQCCGHVSDKTERIPPALLPSVTEVNPTRVPFPTDDSCIPAEVETKKKGPPVVSPKPRANIKKQPVEIQSRASDVGRYVPDPTKPSAPIQFKTMPTPEPPSPPAVPPSEPSK